MQDSTAQTLEAFNTLKSKLEETPVLDHLHSHRQFMIDTDASAYALEAVHFQRQNDSNLEG